jgi:hypothetical protein
MDEDFWENCSDSRSEIMMQTLKMAQDEVLFGADPMPGIVAVEPVENDTMRLFVRRGPELETRDECFVPFLLVENKTLLESLKGSYDIRDLNSTNAFKYLVLFENWGDCQKARDHLRKTTGESASSPTAPCLYFSDPVHQYLLLTGKTIFKGLAFKDIHRLAIDIETVGASWMSVFPANTDLSLFLPEHFHSGHCHQNQLSVYAGIPQKTDLHSETHGKR